jgi:putative transposase
MENQKYSIQIKVSQYTSDIHTKVLKDNEIQIPMDGKGRAIDNIFIKRLWRTFKYKMYI